MRDFKAYLVPAGVIIGMTLVPLAHSLGLLLKLFKKRNGLVYVSCISLLVLTSYALMEYILVDYFSSPYLVDSPAIYIGGLLMAGYVLNFASTFLITVLFLMRIKIFFGRQSQFFKSMVHFAIFLILFKVVGDGIMAGVSFDYMVGEIQSPDSHQWYSTGALLLGISSAAEAVFSAIGTLSFLHFLTDIGNSKTWSSVRFHLLKEEVAKVMVIVGGHIAVVYLSIWFYIHDNYISHTGFYLPALVYALELHFFLDLAHSSAGNILAKARDMSNVMNSLSSFSGGESTDGPMKSIAMNTIRSPVQHGLPIDHAQVSIPRPTLDGPSYSYKPFV